MKKIFIIGASSEICIETAKNIKNIDELFLFTSASNKQDIEKIHTQYFMSAKNIIIKHSLSLKTLIINDYVDFLSEFIFQNIKEDDEVLVLYGSGYMDEINPQILFDINFLAPSMLLNSLNDKLNHATIKNVVFAAISSVSSARGKKSTAFYSSSKSALDTFLEAYQCKDSCAKISAIIIRPGFVSTKMLGDKNVPPFLVVTPKNAGIVIADGIKNKSNIIYTQFIWKILFNLFRYLPLKVWCKISKK